MKKIAFTSLTLMMSACATADHHGSKTMDAAVDTELCQGFGPQTPRDISSKKGTNPITFAMADNTAEMNLCNIHFHNAAEHKGPGFSIEKIDPATNKSQGFMCNMSSTLSTAEKAPYSQNMCKDVNPGDTIEVHWVHSSCDVSPGEGLGACLSDACANPTLRVETQVFTVVNDADAPDFNDYAAIKKMGGKYQPASLPADTGSPVEFLGSTTGPKYTEQSCSPLQVGWSVRPQCAKVSIQSLSQWCEANDFKENKAHGIRELVISPELLSPIK